MLLWLLRHVLAPGAQDVSRERRRLASGLERIAPAAHPRRVPGWAPAIVWPPVAAICVDAASAIAAVLRDPAVPVSDASLADVRSFLTDGCASPLFGRSPADALLAVADLEQRICSERSAHHVAG